jgi:hypothetical protein
VTELIKARCDGREVCEFTVNNDKCPGGDPAPQKRKMMEIAWVCDGDEQKDAVHGDAELLTLSCKPGV